MNRLCRDCDIHPSDGDNMCIGKELKFKYITKKVTVEKK